MIFVLIIDQKKIHIVECEVKVADKFNYLPSEENTPITFSTYEEAETWVTDNVKPEYIAEPDRELTIEEIRSKYLKV